MAPLCPWGGAIDAIHDAPRTLVGERSDVLTGEDVVRRSPEELAIGASLDLETYALARMVESEWGGGPSAGLLAIAEVGRNHARKIGRSISDLLLAVDAGVAPKEADSQRGFFGRQSGRWAATSRTPTRRAVVAARAALEDDTDVAGGARRFFAPHVSDGGIQAGKAIDDALTVYARWTSEGWRFVSEAPIYRAYCLDPYALFVLAKESEATVGLASVAGGRIVLEGARIA